MKKRVAGKVAMVLGSILLLAAGPGATAPRAFPSLVIFRGGGLKAPVAVQHCCVTQVTMPSGRAAGNVARDTLALLYEYLTPATEEQIKALPDSNFFEVGEYFGDWPIETAKGASGNVSTLRRPDLPYLYEHANHYSWIYPAHGSGPAIWERPVVAPMGSNARYYVIGASAEKILASIGVKVR